MDKKSKILVVARELYNQFGYSDVTIRMVANKMGMSSGNLNYHFKKREDILEALYFEMVSEFDDRVKNMDTSKITLKSIKLDILKSMRRMTVYRFFWTDLYNLMRVSEEVKIHFDKALVMRGEGYQILFNALIDKEILSEFEFNNESSFLIERMINFSNTWVYSSFLYSNEISEVYIEKQAQNLISMLYPYLTSKGKLEFSKLES